ncbi:MAG: bifunctional riboflavin kinase/FAD synthetase [Candidatus Kapabacteria bacterium]|nr:bifunctional riboflavin kinase/FAD synthetase [Candidatus Kapabacteria bacterium]
MTIIRYGQQEMPYHKATAITVGTFDGVHQGHAGILRLMRTVADENHERVVVVTFDPHPQIVLAKEGREPLRLLTSMDERCELLAENGVDATVIIPFTHAFASTEASDFITSIIVREIGVQHFFIGHDHMFGKDRGGNEELLQRLAPDNGFSVVPIPPLAFDGMVVSSTKIRQALKRGDVDEARRMLGRPYSVRGLVVRGDGRGRQLGIPTANVRPVEEHKLMPANGVYVVIAEVGGTPLLGMANIGVRPTFTQDTQATLEVHFLDVEADLYGQTLDVAFIAKIRDERRFDSREEFLAQLHDDRIQTTTYLHHLREWRTP